MIFYLNITDELLLANEVGPLWLLHKSEEHAYWLTHDELLAAIGIGELELIGEL
jgi:hypothetical protein